ncbi:polysaccharide deacetylase family protein [Paenibacillus sp. 2RAB27]|uniref:polysaccharide deacetylase family protein n=1 Tax=Paenibacillus sp. 2RAB27 TaxID=3232991 RepID=UPI003F9E67F3
MYKKRLEFKAIVAFLILATLTCCQNPTDHAMYVSHPVLSDPQWPKNAYLTFDDGPSENTERILQILRRYNVHATFFVIGNSSLEGKRLYRLIHADGHVIGNHTYTHNYHSLYESVQAFSKDTERLERLLEQTIGVRSNLLRYPGGSNNLVSRHFGGPNIMPRIINKMSREGYDYMDWNVSSTDAARTVQPKNEIIDAVLSASKNKKEAIILMHDVKVKTTTVEALPTIIEGLLKQGFHFKVLSKDSFHYQFQ